jgi:hypothetical protein
VRQGSAAHVSIFSPDLQGAWTFCAKFSGETLRLTGERRLAHAEQDTTRVPKYLEEAKD